VSLEFASFFQYGVYYKVVVRTTKKRIADDIINSKSFFVLSPEIEDRPTDRQLSEQNARIV
jgi:hypothetical protein